MKLRRNEMRNWCAALAMSALLALPLCAQQKNGRAGDDTTSAATAPEKSAPFSNAAGSSKAVAAKNVFALPATPRPAPFPGPAASAPDTRPPGQLLPRYEFAGMYDYINSLSVQLFPPFWFLDRLEAGWLYGLSRHGSSVTNSAPRLSFPRFSTVDCQLSHPALH